MVVNKDEIRVVVVDDNRADLGIMERLLSGLSTWAANVVLCESGEEALKACREIKPDVVIIDYLLGSETGIDVIRRLRREGIEAAFILLTGIVGEAAAVDALREGASDYFEKSALSADNLERSLRLVMERKQATDTLKKTTALLEAVFDNTHILIAHIDSGFKFIRVNRAFATAAGEAPAYFQGKNLFDLFRDGKLGAEFRKTAATGDAFRAMAEPFSLSAITRYWDMAVEPIKGEKNSVTGLVWTLRDVTDRKKAQDEILRLATAVEQSAEAVVITDTTPSILYVNPAFENVSGYSKAEVLGKNPSVVKSGKHDEVFYERLWSVLSKGEVWSGRFTNRKKGGVLYEEAATISPIKNESGEIVGFVGLKKDVTRESIMEKQLRQAQKMEAMGTLSGGIAHDFNNILSMIIGYSELAMENIPEESEAHEDILEALNAGRRAKDLVRQILTFSRKGEQDKRPIILPPIIKESLKLLRAILPSTIEIRQEISDAPISVYADPTQINQVIVNLCANAEHAMRETGGILTVSIATREVDDEFVLTHLGLKPGKWVEMIVSDTGRGMDRETLDHIFEPFFSTKDTSEGTGMGLAVVHGIIANHGGVITVYTELGRGSAFKIYLPLIDNQSPAETVVEKPIPRGSENILFVDDEESIVKMGEKMLNRLGYSVTAAYGGEQALEAFMASPSQFDILITDQTMPKITGLELARKVMEVKPSMPVIICTGFSHTITADRAKEMGFRYFLSKPANMRDLGEMTRRALDEKKTG